MVELGREGAAFLEQRFGEFDRDGDGVLSPAEQDDMFSTAPCRCLIRHSYKRYTQGLTCTYEPCKP